MRYRVTHHTAYVYERSASASQSEARLLPRSTPRQTCTRAELVIEPTPSDVREWCDYFGNRAVYFVLPEPHETLTVTAVSEVDVHPPDWSARASLFSASLLPADVAWEQVRDELADDLRVESLDARGLVLGSPLVAPAPQLAEYARPSFTPGRPLVDAAVDLTRRIHADFTYDPGATTIATKVDEVLERRAGVCQDFAHLAIGCLRSLGLPARYVSGYLETSPPAGTQRLIGSDDSHAWFAVFLPGEGWVDLDPTNDTVVDERYVITAWGRDFTDVTPLKGVVYAEGGHKLTVSVDVERIGA